MRERRVAFVRHGQTDWNSLRRIQGLTDVPLNATGRQQAAVLGLQLAADGWAMVLSSPLARARGTASLLAAAAGLASPVLSPALIERSYGAAEGLPVEEANTRWPDGDYPGSEPLGALAERGTAAVTALLAGHPGDLIVVSHGALLRATISALTGQPWPRILNGTATFLAVGNAGWEPALAVGPITHPLPNSWGVSA